MTSNAYELVGDIDPDNAPGGIRFGTCAVTTRGAGTSEFKEIALIIDQGINVAKLAAAEEGCFGEVLGSRFSGEMADLRGKIKGVSCKLSDPGEYSDI